MFCTELQPLGARAVETLAPPRAPYRLMFCTELQQLGARAVETLAPLRAQKKNKWLSVERAEDLARAPTPPGSF